MDAASYLQFAASLVFVLALIGAAAFVARRVGLGGIVARRPDSRRRLALVEVLPLDGRRRLVLLRCDAREHLVILGPNGETVVDATAGSAATSFRDCLADANAAPGTAAEPVP